MSPKTRDADTRRLPLAGSAPIFAALGDETRLGLVARLARGDPLSIAQLTEQTPVTRQAVTRHLEVLAEAGLVRGARRGREHLWQLEPARLALARRSLDQISAWWDEKLTVLKRSVEDEAREPPRGAI
jgi:DNA-binding transcriptional ArsR family regulator